MTLASQFRASHWLAVFVLEVPGGLVKMSVDSLGEPRVLANAVRDREIAAKWIGILTPAHSESRHDSQGVTIYCSFSRKSFFSSCEAAGALFDPIVPQVTGDGVGGTSPREDGEEVGGIVF